MYENVYGVKGYPGYDRLRLPGAIQLSTYLQSDTQLALQTTAAAAVLNSMGGIDTIDLSFRPTVQLRL